VSDVTEHASAVSISSVRADDPHLLPAAKHPERVEKVIGGLFLLGIASFVGFVVVYFLDAPAWTYGATLGFGLFVMGVGQVAWGKYLMPRGPFVEERHEMASTEIERTAFAAAIVERGGGTIKRRKVLLGLMGGGVGIFSIAAIIPLLRSFGPQPKQTLDKTNWTKGSFLVDNTGRRISAGELAIGSIVTVFPEGFQNSDEGQAVDQTVLIRLSNENFTTEKGRETWGPRGYLAYSKVCTHLGCPVGLYEQQLQLLVCPCHQSQFDVANGCIPVFGPAPRPLPQLPLYIDTDGYLRSQSGYHQAVGPGFWERNGK